MFTYEIDNLNDELRINSETNHSYQSLDECLAMTLEHEQTAIAQIERPNKKQRMLDATPITFGEINTRIGKDKQKQKIKILLDSGGSGTIVKHDFVKNLRIKYDQQTTWTTTAGNFETKGRCKIELKLPEFQPHTIINKSVHVTKNKMRYDMIIGRDLLREMKVDINFSNQTVVWDGRSIPMKDSICTIDDGYYVDDPEWMESEIARLRDVLDQKYKPADLEEVARSCDNLNEQQQEQLLELLRKHEPLFDGSLGKMNSEPYDIELKENAKPYHAKPFPIPHAHEAKLRAEVQRLCDIGVLTKVNDSEWGAPTWVIPKKDGNTVRFLSDFRELNKNIKCKPYPIPKVQDMLLKLEGFTYATAIDLNMGYYNILLTPASSRLCTIVLPWGKYSYNSLPMGLASSPDIFQEKMSNVFAGLDYV